MINTIKQHVFKHNTFISPSSVENIFAIMWFLYVIYYACQIFPIQRREIFILTAPSIVVDSFYMEFSFLALV